MHTEYDTQTVTNTLALYGVKPHRVWLRRVGITLAGAASILTGTLAGHLIRCVLGW
jgi:hypothetical protein